MNRYQSASPLNRRIYTNRLDNAWAGYDPGESTPLCKPYRYVPSQRVGFLRLFCLKTGIEFAHFGLESGMVYEGTTVVYQCVRRFNSKWIRKKV